MFGSLGTKNVQFNSPHGVAVTKHGHLVIADTGNSRIQVGKLMMGVYDRDYT